MSSTYRRGYYSNQVSGGSMSMPNSMQSMREARSYYDEDDEDQEEIENLFITIRTVLIPQLEQLVSYVLIPMIGGWIFTKLGTKAPVLPSVVNVGFCKICRHPLDLSKTSFVRT